MKDTKINYNKIKSLLLKDETLEPEEISELQKNPLLIADIGYEYIEKEKYEQALKLFCMGISFDSNDPDILNGIGITLCELGKFKKSKLVLEKAVKQNPNDSISYANLAGVCWEMEEYDQAIYYYSKSIEIDPDIEEIHINLINLYIESDSLYMAYISAINFLENFPDNNEAKELIDDILLNLALTIF